MFRVSAETPTEHNDFQGVRGSLPFINVRITIHISSGTLVTWHQRLRILSKSILSYKSASWWWKSVRDLILAKQSLVRRSLSIIESRGIRRYDGCTARKGWIARCGSLRRVTNRPSACTGEKRSTGDNHHHHRHDSTVVACTGRTTMVEVVGENQYRAPLQTEQPEGLVWPPSCASQRPFSNHPRDSLRLCPSSAISFRLLRFISIYLLHCTHFSLQMFHSSEHVSIVTSLKVGVHSRVKLSRVALKGISRKRTLRLERLSELPSMQIE